MILGGILSAALLGYEEWSATASYPPNFDCDVFAPFNNLLCIEHEPTHVYRYQPAIIVRITRATFDLVKGANRYSATHSRNLDLNRRP